MLRILLSICVTLFFVSSMFSQILLFEGFETGTFPPAGWQTVDQDGTPEDNWSILGNGAYQGAFTTIEGDSAAVSYSWLNSVIYTPDNWLISPQLNIIDPNTSLRFKGLGSYGQPNGAIGDFLEVYVSTTGTATTDFQSIHSQYFATETWETVNLPLGSYVGQNIYIAFRHHSSTDQWFIAIDEVIIASPFTDGALTAVNNLSEYSIVPQSQFTSLNNLAVDVTNNGDLIINSYDVATNIYLAPDFTNPIQTFSTVGGLLNVGQTVNLSIGNYSPTGLGTYKVEHIITCANDVNPLNDTISNFFTLSNSEYARDLGNFNGGPLGITLGTELILGQTFTITNTIALDSVLFAISPQIIGGTISVQITTMNGLGLPDETNYIGQSADISIDQPIIDEVATNGLKIINIAVQTPTFTPLILNPGTYFVGIKQNTTANNMGLLNSDGIVTANTNFFNTAGGAYADVTTQLTARTPIIRIFVNDPNLPPVANDDNAVTTTDTPVTVNVVGNDSDPENNLDNGSITIIANPSSGTVTVNTITGEITYTPNTGFNGVDQFTYSICDGATPPLCDQATVTVLVNSTIIDIDGDGFMGPDDCDESNPLIHLGATEIPNNGIDEDCNGSDLTTINQAPIAIDDNSVTLTDTPIIINVVANDSDPDNNLNIGSISIVTNPSSGTVTVNTITGEITYTPNTGFNGVDQFTYSICDGATPPLCDQATVTVLVNSTIIDIDGDGFMGPDDCDESNPLIHLGATEIPNNGIDEDCNGSDLTTATNLAPIATNDTTMTIINTAVTFNVISNDSDPENNLNLNSITIVNQPTDGTVTINFATGEFTYTPNTGFTGTDYFTYSICDGATPPLCSTASVTVYVQNVLPPDANDDSETIFVNSTGGASIFNNDSDPNGDPTIWSGHTVDIDLSVSGIQHTFSTASPAATFIYDGDVFGTINCTPAPGVSGTVTIFYELCDPQTLCDQASVTFNIVFNTASLAENDFNFSIYPNPANTIFVIETDVELKDYRLMNIAGQEMHLTKIEQTKFDVSQLAKGVYYLTLSFENGSIKTVPLIVE